MKHTILAAALLTFAALATSNSCRFSQNNCYKKYDFEINFTCIPQKDTFRVGDTIWIESVIESMLINQLDNSLVDVSEIEYKFYGDIHRYNEEVTSPPEYDFNFINQKGAFNVDVIGPYAALKLTYASSTNHNHVLKVGCIPQAPGLYRIAFYYLTEDYHSIDGAVDNECTETINFTYLMNDANSDNNYHLLLGYPQINTPEGFAKDGSYAFWVEE